MLADLLVCEPYVTVAVLNDFNKFSCYKVAEENLVFIFLNLQPELSGFIILTIIII